MPKFSCTERKPVLLLKAVRQEDEGETVDKRKPKWDEEQKKKRWRRWVNKAETNGGGTVQNLFAAYNSATGSLIHWAIILTSLKMSLLKSSFS